MVISFYLFAAVYYDFLVFLLDLWAKKGMVDKVKDWIEEIIAREYEFCVENMPVKEYFKRTAKAIREGIKKRLGDNINSAIYNAYNTGKVSVECGHKDDNKQLNIQIDFIKERLTNERYEI